MNYLRPDEKAAQSEIEREKRFDTSIKKGTKAAVGLGTAALGAQVSSKIMPFLNKYIPADLAVKGISKISPKIGEYLKKGKAMGLDIDEGLDFIRSKMEKPTENQQEEENPQQNLSVIEQYSAPLYEYIKKLIENGSSPAEAAAKSKKFLDKKQLEIINKIEKDHKTDWLNIVESIFGKGETAHPQQQMQGMQQTQPQQAPQQSGQGQQALMAILQKIQQQRGG